MAFAMTAEEYMQELDEPVRELVQDELNYEHVRTISQDLKALGYEEKATHLIKSWHKFDSAGRGRDLVRLLDQFFLCFITLLNEKGVDEETVGKLEKFREHALDDNIEGAIESAQDFRGELA